MKGTSIIKIKNPRTGYKEEYRLQDIYSNRHLFNLPVNIIVVSIRLYKVLGVYIRICISIMSLRM